MVQRILVDTDILIDAGNGIEAAVNRLESETQYYCLVAEVISTSSY